MFVKITFVLAGVNTGTVVAGLIPAALRHRAPFQTGIGVIIAALFPAVARANPLAVHRAFVGAGRTKGIISISKYD